jgi:hypothetical protein
VALQRLRVDYDERLLLVGVAREVGLRHEAGAPERLRVVEARDADDDRLPGREAVGRVVGRRVDRDALGAARHLRAVERQAPTGRG